MNKKRNIGFAVITVFAVIIGIVSGLFSKSEKITAIADICYGGNAGNVVAVYQDEEILFNVINGEGKVDYTKSIPRYEGNDYVSVLDMVIDDKQNLYILLEYTTPEKEKSQQLAVYDMNGFLFKNNATHTFENFSNIEYKWLNLNNSVFITGIDKITGNIIRDSYDTEQLQSSKKLMPKLSRTYNADLSEGIYELAPLGNDVIFTTKSGKMHIAREDDFTSTEIYPARTLDRVMYPIYFSTSQNGNVFVGEQESGNILSLNPTTLETTVLKNGTEPFFGESSYAPIDILKMSMVSMNDFIGVAKNKSTNSYELLISNDGKVMQLNSLSKPFSARFGDAVLIILSTMAILMFVYIGISLFVNMYKSSRTIVVKLTFTAIPLLIISLMAFGMFSYKTYEKSIVQSFEKQVEDEGNMLTALFGAEVFNEMEYPYDYKTDAYSYLKGQMSTREIYSRTAYFERGTIFTGVDFDAPLFYPFDIYMNFEASNLYKSAVTTGKAQTSIINDVNGIRLSCVTPIGGISGETIYLLETGIQYLEIEEYMNSFLRLYIFVSVVFTVAIGIILYLIFKRVTEPIDKIKAGLEEFASGNTSVRLKNVSNDELSDIIRVFNKMAGDIDIKIYDLQNLSETYFRFIPQKVFGLLGKKNLGEISLGNSIETEYSTLTVNLKINYDLIDSQKVQDITNRCFNALNVVCEKYNATLVTDSVNLRKIQIICPDGSNSAINIALAVLSQVDGINLKLPINCQVNVLFVVHLTKVYYGICGDEQRLIPTIISKELDFIADNEENFRQFSSKLIVTSAAYKQVDKDNYYHRFIGYLNDVKSERFGLYDFYDSTNSEETRLINDTKTTFEKAMQLYLEGRYYEAKNLFALVLRENQYDNVSRHYIFSCEKHL